MSDATTEVAAESTADQSTDSGNGATLQSTVSEPTTEQSASEQEASPQKASWVRQLKREYWDNENAGKFGSPSELFESYLEQQERLGKAVVPPGEDATEEDVQSYYKALGVPDDASGYELPEVEGMPKEYGKKFAELALQAKLTPAQAKTLMEEDAKNYLENESARKQTIQKAEKELREEFGDEFDSKVESANKFLAKVGGEKLLKEFAKSPLGNNPDMVRFVVKMSEAVSEDSLEFGKPGTGREANRSYTTGYPMLNFKGPQTD